MIKVLVKLGENINEVFEEKTAFTWALEDFVNRGHPTGSQLKMLDTLLAEGSNPNFRISLPPSRRRAGLEDDENRIQEVSMSDQTTTALCVAVRITDQSLVNLLLKRKASLADLTAQDWETSESNTRPLSLWKLFRSSTGLQASEMDAFRGVFNDEK